MDGYVSLQDVASDPPSRRHSPSVSPSLPSLVPLANFGLEPPIDSVHQDGGSGCKSIADGLAESMLPKDHHHEEHSQQSLLTVPFWRKLLAFTGPGWLMSIAYVDPGNLEADLQCGAQFGYRLLWALLASTAFGLGMQLIAARIGTATGRHLAEICREYYPFTVRVLLWLLTELAIIGSDIQEVIGCAIGLQILLGLPLPGGVILTAGAAFCLLFLEDLGPRALEMFFGFLILVLALSMGGIFVVINPDPVSVVEGFVLPYMPAPAVMQVVGMVGCVVMPHNLFLHSALVRTRIVEEEDKKEAITLFNIESSIAIFTSLIINMFVVAVFAKGFYGKEGADDIGLQNAGHYLGQEFGQPLRVIWALGLVAAGQSSTMTGAYAGQWVMQGYLNLRVKAWKRAIITRGVALVPCLGVAIYFGGGASGLDALNGYLNVLQSLVLPFALVPLLTFAGSERVMGKELALSRGVMALSWCGAIVVVLINVYMFYAALVLGGDSEPGAAAERSPGLGAAGGAGLCVFLVCYAAAVLYAAWAPDVHAG